MPKPEPLGRYLLRCPEGVFPLCGDTLALGRFATVRPGWNVCDLGTGSGALLLLLADREASLTLTGVEQNELAARTARENLQENRLEGAIVQADLRRADLPPGRFDLVISNPPYFPVDSGTSGGAARCEDSCTLDELCATAARLVKNGGRFALCHRPERLCEVFCSLREHGLEPKRLQLLAHSPVHAPSAVLVEAVRQAKPGLAVLPTQFAAHESE